MMILKHITHIIVRLLNTHVLYMNSGKYCSYSSIASQLAVKYLQGCNYIVYTQLYSYLLNIHIATLYDQSRNNMCWMRGRTFNE